MVASISVTIRYAIMGVMLTTIFFTIQSEANTVKKSLHHEKMEKIAQYTADTLTQDLKMMYEYNTTIQKRLHYPHIQQGPGRGFTYTVKFGCQDNDVLINVSSNRKTESSTLRPQLKCSWINATGEVIPGERCMTLNKKNATTINAKLVNDCGA